MFLEQENLFKNKGNMMQNYQVLHLMMRQFQMLKQQNMIEDVRPEPPLEKKANVMIEKPMVKCPESHTFGKFGKL